MSRGFAEGAAKLVAPKISGTEFHCETALELFPAQWGEEAGLAVIGESWAALAVQHDGLKSRIVLHADGKQMFDCELASNKVRLRVEVQAGGKRVFSFAERGIYGGSANVSDNEGKMDRCESGDLWHQTGGECLGGERRF